MKKIVFYGDSITEGFELLKQNSNVINMGVSGDKTINLVARITDVIKESPDRIIIMIGTNDYLVKKKLWQDYVSINFRALYSALLTLIKDNLPNAEVVLLSILPISEKDVDLEQYNKEIDEYNNIIKELSIAYNCTYKYISSSFKTERNEMKKEYTLDGVHLSSKGYSLFYNLIEDLLK